MKTIFSFLFATCCPLLTLASGNETVTLANTEGKELEVVIINVKDNKVKARKVGNFTPFEIPLDRLSKASQDYLQEWLDSGKNKSKDIAITTQFVRDNVKSKKTQQKANNKNKSNQKNNYQTTQRGFTETRTYSVIPKISVRNRHSEFKFETGSAVIFVYPKPKQGPEKQIIEITSIDALKTGDIVGSKISYATTETTTFTTKKGVTKSSTKNTGHDFGGYAVFILDGDGSIIAEKASKNSDLDRYRDLVN